MNFLDERLPPHHWSKIQPCPMTGCWLWVGATLANGYGSVGVRGSGSKSQLAHRYVYTMLVGPIPVGLQLDHLCRVRCCVNPAHLEPVTQQVNIARGEASKHWTDRTHCPKGHAYAGANLRVRSDRGGVGRECRACHQVANREYRLRRSESLRPLSAEDIAIIDRLFAAVSDDEVNALMAGVA